MKRAFGILTLVSALSGSAGLEAASLANPSFESDVYTVWPGYTSGNGGTLTGWTSNDPGRSGLNSQPPTWNPPNTSPFANNGAIPDGTQASFIQSTNATTTLSNTITGLVTGQTYKITLRFTGRNSGAQRPNATVTVGGSTVSFQANPVEAANTFTQPYRTAAVVFTATGASAPLSISNFTTGDTTIVVDDIQVVDGGSKWTATAWNDDASSGIDAALTYSHAYNVGSATGTTINGVGFTGVGGANPAVGGSFSTSGWTTPLADAVNNINSGGSAAMADDFVYGGAAQTAQILTLDGLTAGQPYRLTLFGVGWNDANVPFRSATFDNGSGDLLTINEQQFGADNGIKVQTDFIPLGSSQSFTLNTTSSATTFHLYGFANAAVPEPACASLAACCALAFGLRRRRA